MSGDSMKVPSLIPEYMCYDPVEKTHSAYFKSEPPFIPEGDDFRLMPVMFFPRTRQAERCEDARLLPVKQAASVKGKTRGFFRPSDADKLPGITFVLETWAE